MVEKSNAQLMLIFIEWPIETKEKDKIKVRCGEFAET